MIQEKLVLSLVSSYLSSHNLHNTCQSEYRPGHSTETSLLKLVDDLFLSLNKGNISVLALLDFSSAFDTIDHPTLVQYLHTDIGFTDTVLQWFSSYLNDHTHYVSPSSHCSAFATPHSGAPQDSVLGPATCYFELRRLASIRRFLTSTTTATLVSTFVLSINDYCNSLLLGSTHEVTSHLQRIQNYSARIILRLPRSSSITTHFKSLHWPPVKARSTYKIACLCYHCHSSTAPSYVADMLQIKPSHASNTFSSTHTMPTLNRPAHSRAALAPAHTPCLLSIDLHTVGQHLVLARFLLLLVLSGTLLQMTSGVSHHCYHQCLGCFVRLTKTEHSL